jgi:RNA polymerase sigma-70 factor (ECF subfamily)
VAVPRGQSGDRPPPADAEGAPPVRADRAGFEQLYESFSREVWALAYARRMDPDLARDVMHEAFLRLWRAWSAGEEVHNPRGWLLRVARNLAEDQAKSAFRKNGTQGPDFLTALPAVAAAAPDRLERDELFGQLRSELRRLPEADREVLTLRYALDYEVPRIAAALGTTVAAVHMRLSRARQRLAERLAARGVTHSP